MEALVLSREGGRKEGGQFPGAGHLMDGWSRICLPGEGMGMRGLAGNTNEVGCPEFLQNWNFSRSLLCVVAFDLKSYTSSWQLKPVHGCDLVNWVWAGCSPAPTPPGQAVGSAHTLWIFSSYEDSVRVSSSLRPCLHCCFFDGWKPATAIETVK